MFKMKLIYAINGKSLNSIKYVMIYKTVINRMVIHGRRQIYEKKIEKKLSQFTSY